MYARRHIPRQWKELKWSGKAFNMSIIKLFLCHTEPPASPKQSSGGKTIGNLRRVLAKPKRWNEFSVKKKKKKNPSIHGFIRYNTIIKVNIRVMFYDQSKTIRPNK